jgi:hypothetical protein
MKNLIAISAAALTTAAASANVAVYTSSTAAGWTNDTYYASRVIMNDNLAYANQPTAGGTVFSTYNGSGFYEWGNWSASAGGAGTMALSGAGYGTSQTMTANPGGTSITVTFTTPAPVAYPTHGIMGAGVQFTYSGTVGAPWQITIAFANGSSTTQQFDAVSGGFVGVWNQNPVTIGGSTTWYKINSITVSTSGTGNLAVTNVYAGYVPAPGAVALVGVAGLIGSRRRRA